MKRWLLSAVTSLLFCTPSALLWAQPVTANLDPAATHVDFTLGDTLHTVHGTFRLKTGTLTLDSATGKASGTLVVDAASGASGNRTRDGKMSRDILEAQKFPELTFTAQQVIGKLADAGPSHLEIRGLFRIRGQDHPLTLVVDAQSKAGVADAVTKFEVPYVAWGMQNPSKAFLKVSPQVEISIRTQAHLLQLAPATR